MFSVWKREDSGGCTTVGLVLECFKDQNLCPNPENEDKKRQKTTHFAIFPDKNNEKLVQKWFCTTASSSNKQKVANQLNIDKKA